VGLPVHVRSLESRGGKTETRHATKEERWIVSECPALTVRLDLTLTIPAFISITTESIDIGNE
jgi:hypothetical protein